MAGDRTLRTAIVGLRHGHVGSFGPESPGYLHTLQHTAGVEIVAFCEDADPARLQEARRHYPAAGIHTSVDDLIEQEDFELAWVVLPAADVLSRVTSFPRGRVMKIPHPLSAVGGGAAMRVDAVGIRWVGQPATIRMRMGEVGGSATEGSEAPLTKGGRSPTGVRGGGANGADHFQRGMAAAHRPLPPDGRGRRRRPAQRSIGGYRDTTRLPKSP